MTLRISGKSISVGEALRNRVSERTEEVLRKYFDGNYSGHITLSKDGFGFRTDCALHLDSGVVLEADSSATDAYASTDQALLLIEKRLRRYKSRLKERKYEKADAGGVMVSSYVLEAPDEEADVSAEHEFAPTVIAETTTRLSAMTIAAAVMELDMTGVTVLPFRHEASGRVNIIYRRSDGNIGWLDPAAADKAKASS